MEQLIKPLKGAIQRDYKKCKRVGCKCATGALHGPYFVRVWYEEGKRRKVYVKPTDAPLVEAGIRLFQCELDAERMKKQLARRINSQSRALYQGRLSEIEGEINRIKNGELSVSVDR